MPVVSVPRCEYSCACCYLSHTRLRVHWAPGIPHALCFQGREIPVIARAHRAAGRGCMFENKALLEN
jgi:hypothetical protein